MSKNNATNKKSLGKLGEYFKSTKFKPSKLSKYFWIFSGTILLIGFIMLCTLGFNLGMDFTGGNIVEIEVGEELDEGNTYNEMSSTITNILSQEGLTVSQIQKVGTGSDLSLQVQYQNKAGLTDSEMAALNTELQTLINDAFNGEYNVLPAESKSATASGDLLLNSALALLIAIIVMLIYIAIRFELVSGLSAIITLVHDVLMMCAFVIIFRIEVNSAFIAGLITIMGYSINNTIVVFDRVRENLKKPSLKDISNVEIADLSIRQTLTRTFGTSITTIAAVFMLAIIGVDSIREFIIPILLGLVVGTYASVFISAPLWATFMNHTKLNKRKDSKGKIEDIDLTKINVVETTATPVKESK